MIFQVLSARLKRAPFEIEEGTEYQMRQYSRVPMVRLLVLELLQLLSSTSISSGNFSVSIYSIYLFQSQILVADHFLMENIHCHTGVGVIQGIQSMFLVTIW